MKSICLMLVLFSAFLPPVVLPARTVSIHQIKAEKGKRGEYQTEGYVIKTYICPPCPPRAQCKPCMMNTNIVISEVNKSLNSYELTDKDIILFTRDAAPFEIGKKYLFTIKITDRKTTSEPLNDIELIEYKPSK